VERHKTTRSPNQRAKYIRFQFIKLQPTTTPKPTSTNPKEEKRRRENITVKLTTMNTNGNNTIAKNNKNTYKTAR